MSALVSLAALVAVGAQSYRERYPLPTATVPDGLGVNVHFRAARPGELAKIKAVGFRWVRADLTWARVEPSPGRFDFARFDALIRSFQNARLRMVLILAYDHPAYGGGPPLSGQALEAWKRYVTKVVSRYRGKGIVWEVWNEPNEAEFWRAEPDPRDYGRLARETVGAIRRVAPAEWVVGPALSGVDRRYAQGIGFTSTGLDAFSFHPYRTSDPLTAVRDIAALRAALPSGTPLLCTEWGYGVGKQASSDRDQANKLVRAYLANLAAGVPLTIFYAWTDGPEDPNPAHRRFGIVRPDMAEKEAARSLSRMVRELGGYRLERVSGDTFTFRKGSSVKSLHVPR